MTLTDEDFIDNVMSIFQQYYPNTIRIEYDNSHTKEIQQTDVAQMAVNKTFGEMISDFYQLVYGCEISEEELALMNKIAGEAGVTNEAD